ncbi:hypothetical protein C9374_012877 [Naegleria lovaniensis]|uniref:Importin subunit alpha n=1 Tax=Naegleria lovaniensis TaxID=51637 RepID=A0AA88GAJ1_NAELO|nr:uncharacterized protein C9374_012877 [Naegleria lovaniensis]KAG2373031.1 hypothetical protein C9374_012877 [Naegleria lovaniensis]
MTIDEEADQVNTHPEREQTSKKIEQREVHLARKREKYCRFKTSSSHFVSNIHRDDDHPVVKLSQEQFSENIQSSDNCTLSYELRRKSIPNSEMILNFPRLSQSLILGCNSFLTILRTAVLFRKILSEPNPPITPVIESGATMHFAKYLKFSELEKYFDIDVGNHDENIFAETKLEKRRQKVDLQKIYALQFEAIWAITNVASGTSEHTKHIVDIGCIPSLVQLLETYNNDYILEQCCWALGNIAGDSANMRDFLLMNGALRNIVNLVSMSQSLSVVRCAAWAISNLVRGNPKPSEYYVLEALPALSRLIFSTDNEVLSDTAWALSYVTDGANDRIQAVIDSNCVKQVITLLSHDSHSVVAPALRIIGNIASGDDVQTEYLVSMGILPIIHTLLVHSKKSIRKEAVWTISNICAGSPEQIQAAIDAGLILKIIERMEQENFDVKKEAMWTLSNYCCGANFKQLEYIIECGVISKFCDALNSSDHKYILVALEGLDSLMTRYKEGRGNVDLIIKQIETNNGSQKIEQLIGHRNKDISALATELLQMLEDTGGKEEDDEQYHFGLGGMF